MLHPPSIFRARIIFIAAERSIWCSSSERVCDGATTTLSPVCTPIGSMFSMLQMVMQLSYESRIISYSNSPQPSTDSSTSIWCVGESVKPSSKSLSNSAWSLAIPPPVPPRVNAGRSMSGKGCPFANACASSFVLAATLSGMGSPIFCMSALNFPLSSAASIASMPVPSISTPYFASIPFS